MFSIIFGDDHEGPGMTGARRKNEFSHVSSVVGTKSVFNNQLLLCYV